MAEIVVSSTVRDLDPHDLPRCAWSGGDLHVAQLAAQVERARTGAVDYLAACPPSTLPVALGGVDYEVEPGAGTLWQLAVHPAMQSCGIGTLLVRAAEDRIRARGLDRAELVPRPGTFTPSRPAHDAPGRVAATPEYNPVRGRSGAPPRHAVDPPIHGRRSGPRH